MTRTASGARLIAGLALLQAICLIVAVARSLASDGAPTLQSLLTGLATPEVILAVAVAAASSLIPGSLAALALWRRRHWGLAAGLLIAPALLPLGALAPGPGLAALLTRTAGHASLGLAIGTGCGLIALARADIGVLRAAAACGVSPLGTLWRVMLPLMAPGIAAGVLLSATASAAIGLIGRLPAAPAGILAIPAVAWLAAAGIALLLTAVTSASVILLRRR